MTCNSPKQRTPTVREWASWLVSKNNASSLKKFVLLALTVLLSAGMGCQKPTIKTTQPTTAFDPQVQNRNWSPQLVYYQPVAVEHETLYLVGPYEQSGGDGIYDEIKTEDFWAALLCPAVFLGNVAAMPVSMIRTPPFQSQQSRSIFPIEAPAYEPQALQSNP